MMRETCIAIFPVCFSRKSIPGEPGKDYPIYSIDILCKINPGQCGGARSSPAAGKAAQGAKPAPAPQVRWVS